MRYKMKDVTILIPVRIDSYFRLENLCSVVKYLTTNYLTNIYVVESAEYNNNILKTILPKQIKYMFKKDNDPVFFRTQIINNVVGEIHTKYVSIWDADVLFPVRQILRAIELLRSDKCDFVYPYDGSFMDTTQIVRQIYLEYGDVNILEELSNMMSAPYGIGMKGGAFIANTQKYKEAGMENLKFYGWGPEDWERYERWKNLNYRIEIVTGKLFHLSHPRDMNGTHNSYQQKIYSFYEKDITSFSSKEEIVKRMNLQNYSI